MVYFFMFMLWFFFSFWRKGSIFLFFLFFIFGLVSILFLLKSGSVGNSIVGGGDMFYPFKMDWVSFWLVFLSMVVIWLSVCAGFGHLIGWQISYYLLFFLIMFSVLMLFFSVGNLLFFFFLFEMVLLPMIMVIGFWGSQVERIFANYYFFLYTVISGFPLMSVVIMSYKQGFFFYSALFLMSGGYILMSSFFMLAVLLAFLCKLPMYGLHVWLPKAHVEAPVSGSMVLASLLLKMGGYSIFRFFSISYVCMFGLKVVFFCVLLVGVLYPMVICMNQLDVKSFIAYSSVGHMCVSVLSLLTCSYFSIKGAVLIFLAHSLISPAMFYSANLLYERISSRSLLSLGGFDKSVFGLSTFVLVFLISNMGYPPFLSFFSELSVYFSLVLYGSLVFVFVFLSMLISGIVMFFYISKVMKSQKNKLILFDLSMRELLLMFFMYFVLFLMVFMVSVL